MVESPSDLTDKEREMLSPHAANTGKLAFQNTPKPFDMVSMDFTTRQLTAIMVDIFMPASVLW